MIFLKNDYSEGAHPSIIEAIGNSNLEQQMGYGLDTYTECAEDLIRKAIGCETAQVHLLVGGTQTNTIAIKSFLRPIEAVICVESGHIAVHETGAIEAIGHKVITVKGNQGKITPFEIEQVCSLHLDEHMVMPKLVYISNSTELGTIYTKKELYDIAKVCKEKNLLLYMDGARLAAALVSEGNDLTLLEIASMCDAFYIGGTKCGAMFGEALIITNNSLKNDVRYYIKQQGGLLAKGRFLGIQFACLMKDGLMFSIAEYANERAVELACGIENLGFSLLAPQETNQVFVILPNEIHKELEKVCYYEVFQPHDERSVEARFVTSFATPEEDIQVFLQELGRIKEYL